LEPAGEVDGSFRPLFTRAAVGAAGVQQVLVQPDGNLLIAGGFTFVNGLARPRLARLLADGTSDATFRGQPPVGETWRYVPGHDGEVLAFSSAGFIGRLAPDGRLAQTLSAPGRFRGVVRSVVPAAGANLWVAGEFSHVDGQKQHALARLRPDGTFDSTFRRVIGPETDSTSVDFITVQPDGRFFIGGDFTSVDGVPLPGRARLTPDGSLDVDFESAASVNTLPLGRPDGMIYLVHAFTVEMLDKRERRDTTFHKAEVRADSGTRSIYAQVVQPDGRLLVGGSFDWVNQTRRPGLARLNLDGGVDTGFKPALNPLGEPRVDILQLDENGRILVAGLFTTSGRVPREGFARLNPDGSLDESFNPDVAGPTGITALLVQEEQRIIVGGDFTAVDGIPRRRIARLNLNGSPDPTFDPGAGADDRVTALAVQPDGKVLAGGQFTSFGGVPRRNLVRLHADGSVDTGFDVGSGPVPLPGSFVPTIKALAFQFDGKTLVGGSFTNMSGRRLSGVARLDADGRVDATFRPGSGAGIGQSRGVSVVVPLPDGRLIVGGTFDMFDDTRRFGIARLNADGTLDAGFNPTAGPNPLVGSVAAALFLSDGRLLVAGDLRASSTNRGLLRLRANGRVDANFVSPRLTNFFGLARQPDGRILVGYRPGSSRYHLGVARLNPDGTLDPGFVAAETKFAGEGFLALAANGMQLLLGGSDISSPVPFYGLAKFFTTPEPC
jgi:uncharacterized delta-60 repeat protein